MEKVGRFWAWNSWAKKCPHSGPGNDQLFKCVSHSSVGRRLLTRADPSWWLCETRWIAKWALSRCLFLFVHSVFCFFVCAMHVLQKHYRRYHRNPPIVHSKMLPFCWVIPILEILYWPCEILKYSFTVLFICKFYLSNFMYLNKCVWK